VSGYVIACYAVTVGALGAYAAWVITKYRAISKRDDA
jgi:hypothetical protein